MRSHTVIGLGHLSSRLLGCQRAEGTADDADDADETVWDWGQRLLVKDGCWRWRQHNRAGNTMDFRRGKREVAKAEKKPEAPKRAV